MPSTFKWQGQEWEIPIMQNESLLNIRPSIFISYFFAIASNKRGPASSSNKHFLTEAYKTTLERKLNLKPADDQMQKALQRWKEDKYWTIGHGGPDDPFSTRANPSTLIVPNSQLSLKAPTMKQNEIADTTPEKQLECFFWRRDGFCRFSEEECLYAHHPTGKVKEYNDSKDRDREKEGNTFRSYRHTSIPIPKKTECYFWGLGICKFSAEDCMYAHYRINDAPEYDWGRRDGRYDSPEERYHNDQDVLPSKEYECFFWRRDGHCKFSEEECLYAHHPTGKVKEIPGYPKLGDRDAPLSERIQPAESLRISDNSHSEKMSQEYTMPKPPSMQLSELTLSAFFDLFCYNNPVARKERPWEAVLTMYKTYVLRNFGKDAAKHVLAAYARTRLPIPSELLKKHTLQLDDELAKKEALSSAAFSGKGSEPMPNGNSKRVRSADDVEALATSKRMKAEKGVAATPTTQEAVTVLIQEVRDQNTQNAQESAEDNPRHRSTRLYSPSMPDIAASQSGFIESKAHKPAAKNGETIQKEISSFPAKTSGTVGTKFSGSSIDLIKPQRDSVLALETSNTIGSPLSKSKMYTKPNGETSAAPQINGISQNMTGKPPVKTSDSGRSQILQSLSHSLPTLQGSCSASLPNSSLGAEAVHSNPQLHAISSPTQSHLSNNTPSVATVLQGHNTVLQDRSTNELVRSNGHVAVGPKTYEQDTMIKHPTAYFPAPVQSSSALGTYISQERPQEPLGAHIVRLEALLRGALMELETLKRAVG